MIFLSNEQWREYGINERAHQFFTLRWKELFDDETFDSWQVRTSSLKTVLQEMKLAAETVGRVHAHHPNIEYLIEEAEAIIKKDPILATSFPFASDYLIALKHSYESKVKNQEKLDLASFLRTLSVMRGNLGNYSNQIFDAVHSILAKPPAQFKKDLYSLCLYLGTDLISEGYSTLALKDSVNILLTPGTEFIERFIQLKEMFSGKTTEYTCRFLIQWPKDLLEIDGFEINLTEDRPAGTTSEEREFYAWNTQQAIVAVTKVEAKDLYSARYLAEKQVEDLFAVEKLYQKNKERTLYEKALITPNGDTGKMVSEDLTRLGLGKEPKLTRDRLTTFTKVRSKLSSNDAEQLDASLQFHKLALHAPTDESRLVNLWIALESLVQDGGSSIIGRICKYIPKSCATGYTERKVKAFAIDAKKLWASSETDELLEQLKQAGNGNTESKRGYIDSRDMLRIILDGPYGPLIDRFAALAAKNQLLIYRLSSLVDEFSTPEKLASVLDSNINGVIWQLRRIYRTRNHITHKGISLNGIRQLIQHLNSYYIAAYFNLIHDLEHNPEWSIADAFEHRVNMYDYVVSRLKNYEQGPLSFEMLMDMSLALTDPCKKGAWKPTTPDMLVQTGCGSGI